MSKRRHPLRTHNKRAKHLQSRKMLSKLLLHRLSKINPEERFGPPMINGDDDKFLFSRAYVGDLYVPQPFDVYGPGGPGAERLDAWAAEHSFTYERVQLFAHGAEGSRSSWINLRFPDQRSFDSYLETFGEDYRYADPREDVMGRHYDASLAPYPQRPKWGAARARANGR